MAADSPTEDYQPTYRQQDVDNTLDEHHTRIRRLEKAALIGAGYGLANGADIASVLMGVI